MRRFMVHLVTEIDFVDGDEASDVAAQNYQKHLSSARSSASTWAGSPTLWRACAPTSPRTP
jgi:hypothetical protein